MTVIDFNKSFYCLSIKNNQGGELIYFYTDVTPGSTRKRLDLFENEEVMHVWIREEQKILAKDEMWSTFNVYNKLYPKKIFITEIVQLMKEDVDLDCITYIDHASVRRLYFKSELENNDYFFPTATHQLHPREPIYMICRQRKLNSKVTLQKESYFVVYPEIALPLFSAGKYEWAEELISKRPNEGYYIEKTNLHDVYKRSLIEGDNSFFLFSREVGSHFLLRDTDIRKIIDGKVIYQ